VWLSTLHYNIFLYVSGRFSIMNGSHVRNYSVRVDVGEKSWEVEYTLYKRDGELIRLGGTPGSMNIRCSYVGGGVIH
jgi:hypothetical protein